MNLKEKLAALYKEGRALADKSEKDGLSSAEEARWAEIKGQIEETRTALAAQEQREREAQEFRAGDREYNQAAGQQRASGVVARETPDQARANDRRYAAGLADRVMQSEQWAEFRSAAHRGASAPAPVGSFYRGHQASLMHRNGMTPEELRTLVYTGALPSDMIAPQRIPGVFMPDFEEVTVRSAFLNGQTDSNAIEFYRELLFTNNAAFVAEATATSPTTLGQSGVKPESALTFERDSALVQTLAHWIPITNAAAADEPQLRTLIDARLLDGLRTVEDDALLNGDGNAPNISGLLDVSGTQSADDAYFSSNAVEDAGTPNEDFNRILRARRLVRITGRARPTFVFLNPIDHERMLSTTDGNRQYMAGGPFSAGMGINSLWGLRVIETESLASGSFVVGDGRMAAVWDRMQATVQVGLINDQFIRNMQTILAEERVAFTVYRPAAFVVGSFA